MAAAVDAPRKSTAKFAVASTLLNSTYQVRPPKSPGHASSDLQCTVAGAHPFVLRSRFITPQPRVLLASRDRFDARVIQCSSCQGLAICETRCRYHAGF